MRKIIFLTTLIAVILNEPTEAQIAKLTSKVDPFIGSKDHGHVFVGANIPFGAVHNSAQHRSGWVGISLTAGIGARAIIILARKYLVLHIPTLAAQVLAT